MIRYKFLHATTFTYLPYIHILGQFGTSHLTVSTDVPWQPMSYMGCSSVQLRMRCWMLKPQVELHWDHADQASQVGGAIRLNGHGLSIMQLWNGRVWRKQRQQRSQIHKSSEIWHLWDIRCFQLTFTKGLRFNLKVQIQDN